jgi:toxin ParE1/3/4
LGRNAGALAALNMARVIVSPTRSPIRTTFLSTWLARRGSPPRRKYDAAFRALLSRLAVFPGLGAPRPELGEGIRTYVLHPYVVIYEGGPGSETAVIHRIVHGRRDIRADIIKS